MKIIDNIIDNAKLRGQRLYDYLKEIFLQDYEFPVGGVFGNLLSAVSSITNNFLLYIEDIFNEHNTETAKRKSSVISLAKLSGYQINTGTAARVKAKFIMLNNNNTKLKVKKNGRFMVGEYTFNLMEDNDIVIPTNQEYTLIEGVVKKQQSIADGTKLYTVNIKDSNIDVSYIRVYVNNILYKQKLSLYDMKADEYAYVVSTSIDKGIDITFGDGFNGHQLVEDSVIVVEYLTHSGVITLDKSLLLNYIDELTYSDNSKVDTLVTVKMQILDYMNGTNCDTYNKVKRNIGKNTRNSTLSTKDEIKSYINNYSNIVCIDVLTNNNQVCPIVINRLNINKPTSVRDVLLSETRRCQLLDALSASKEFICGTNIYLPDLQLQKFAINVTYTSDSDIDDKIEVYIKKYFNIFPDGDCHHIYKDNVKKYLKENIKELKDIIISFQSEIQNKAEKDMEYTLSQTRFDADTNTYRSDVVRYLYHGQNINLDEFGNISIDDLFSIPVLANVKDYINNYMTKQINITHV